jgi:hypothetical protein
MDLAGQLDCDGPPADFGQEVPPVVGPTDPAGGPDQALDTARLLYWNLPARGFEATRIESGWARHRYLVGGRVKAIAVSTNVFVDVPAEKGWEVVGVRACDPSEFRTDDLGPLAGGIWFGADGRPSRTDLITSFPGPGHCGWESTVFLTYDRQQFLRDPKHVLREYTVTGFDVISQLPDDAVDTGLHTKEWRLFTIPSGRAVFMQTGDGHIELWPRAREPIGCA